VIIVGCDMALAGIIFTYQLVFESFDRQSVSATISGEFGEECQAGEMPSFKMKLGVNSTN
jgi:hypothetical protein